MVIKDKTKKAILADRLDEMPIRAIAKKYGVSPTSVQRIIKRSPDLKDKFEEKKGRNMKDILAHMDSKKQAVCDIIDLCLDELPDKIKKAKNATEITTAMGTVIDKFTKVPGVESEGALPALIAALKER